LPRRPPSAAPFPYTTLFRSRRLHAGRSPAVGPLLEREGAVRVGDREGGELLAVEVDPARVEEAPSGVSDGPRAEALGRVHQRLRSEEHTSELQSREKLVCRL